MGNNDRAHESLDVVDGEADSKIVSNADEAIIPSLMHRSFRSEPHNVVAAKGIYLILSSGRQVIDACAGAAVASIGHGNEEVLEAVCKQMNKVSYLHSLAYTTDVAEELAHFLVHGPGGASRHGLDRVFLVNSGSEAIEAALKLAVQYFWEKGDTGRTKFVARKQGYHGNTIGAMNVSSNLPRKIQYPCFQLKNVSWVSPAYAYQYSFAAESEEQYTSRLLNELEQHFISLGPETVVAFIAEPVVGATSACTLAPKGYFRGVREICDRYSILLILDEIMCGMGRTGSNFAFEQEGIVPDLVTVAKGLGGGYSPVAGLFVHKKVVDVLKSGSGYFNHGQTYQAHPVCCAATLAVQRIIHREELVQNCAQKGQILHKLLLETCSDCKYIGDIRGRGLFWGIEFVQDKISRRSFAPELVFGARFQAHAFELGVAVYPGMGTVDGIRGDHAVIAPPYNVTKPELILIVEAISKAYTILEKEIDGKIRKFE